jgi:hypothetical protein
MNLWTVISGLGYGFVSPNYCYTFGSWDSVVGIATGYGMEDRGAGARVPVGSRIFSSPRRPNRLWGPPNLLSNEYRRLFPLGVKGPGLEADHSTPTSAEVTKMWICTSTPPRPSWLNV